MEINKEEESVLKQNSVPIAIIIAGVLIAGAVFFSSGDGSASNNKFGNNLSLTASNVLPVDDNDHIKGNPNAEVTMVEYSDYECPFCQRVHSTLTQIVEDFDGDVRWVYRHFPLTSIHSEAFASSVASECVAQLGGNDAFWSFTDQIFNNQQSLGNSLYESIATNFGISIEDFQTCMQDDKISEIVQKQTQNAVDSGGRGTPYIIVINGDGETFPFSGALPYDQIKSIIEQALSN